MPKEDDREKAEKAYSDIASFIKSKVEEANKRVYSITYKHNGKTMVATVGENCDPYYEEKEPLVCAIFSGNPYKICLPERGVVCCEPIYVGSHHIISESLFDSE